MPLCMHICHASEGIHARNYLLERKESMFFHYIFLKIFVSVYEVSRINFVFFRIILVLDIV